MTEESWTEVRVCTDTSMVRAHRMLPTPSDSDGTNVHAGSARGSRLPAKLDLRQDGMS
jgi:hypothetical protein